MLFPFTPHQGFQDIIDFPGFCQNPVFRFMDIFQVMGVGRTDYIALLKIRMLSADPVKMPEVMKFRAGFVPQEKVLSGGTKPRLERRLVEDLST